MNSLIAVSAVLFSSSVVSTAASKDDAPESFVIRNVQIFDGERARLPADVSIADGKIVEIGSNVVVAKSTQEIDGTGHTLLPGFIDSHTHTISADILEQSLALGVTTELDMFASVQMLKGIRAEQERGTSTTRADLFSAGTLVTAPGGHGTQFGFPIPTIEAAGDAQAFVDARLEEGSDYIKIVYDTGENYGVDYPTIDKLTLGELIVAAHARDKLAVVHIGSWRGAMDALELGADGLVHIFFEVLDEAAIVEFVKLAKEKGVFVTPTLTVVESAKGTASGAGLAKDERIIPYLASTWLLNLSLAFPAQAMGDEGFEWSMTAVRELSRIGVPILAGSDAPNPGTAHGASIHRELELLVQAGLSPVEALRATTSAPARRFALGDRGTIEVGKRADLLLVKGDPTSRITATRDIVSIWKAGHLVDRKAIAQRLAKLASPIVQATTDGVGDGQVSNFEKGDLSTNFGAGWSISTDSFMGGKSTASMEVVEEGANGTTRAMRVTGEVSQGAQPWAGVMFSPGSGPMAAADLTSMSAVTFWAKGKPGTYFAMMFMQSMGYTPAVKPIQVTEDWQAFSIQLSDFNKSDGSGLMGFYVGAGIAGEFEFWIDEVRFVK